MAKSNRPELVRNRRVLGRQTLLSFPSKPFPHGLQLIFKDYSYRKYVLADGVATSPNEEIGLGTQFVPLASQRAENTDIGSIELPFPRSLTDATNIRVTQFERDFMTERAIGALSTLASDFGGTVKQVRDIVSSAGQAIGEGIGQEGALRNVAGKIKDTFKGLTDDRAFAMASYLGRNFLGGGVSQSVGMLGGAVVNPQETLSFTGVDLRTFSFSWDLFPSNREDTDQIEKIVRYIKNKSLPETEGVGAGEDGQTIPGLSRAFLKYPSVVELNLLGVDERHFVRFKPCMVTNVSVQYGSGGTVTIMNGGVPNAVTLTVEFQEMSIQTAEDYNVSDVGSGESDGSGNGVNQ